MVGKFTSEMLASGGYFQSTHEPVDVIGPLNRACAVFWLSWCRRDHGSFTTAIATAAAASSATTASLPAIFAPTGRPKRPEVPLCAAQSGEYSARAPN